MINKIYYNITYLKYLLEKIDEVSQTLSHKLYLDNSDKDILETTSLKYFLALPATFP